MLPSAVASTGPATVSYTHLNAAGKVLVGLLSDSDLLAESYVLITVE